MARKRTQNYREMRADFDEAGGGEEEAGDEEEGDEEEGDEEEEEGEADAEADPAAEADDGEEGDEDDEDAPKKKKPKAKVKAKPKPKPKRTRAVKVTRMRVVWGVFNNSHQKVAEFDYPKKADADAHAAKLMADKKSTHFVQPIKEAIEEKKEDKK